MPSKVIEQYTIQKEKDELDDITAITDEHFRLYKGQCDIITGGFPCQAFSIAGNRKGFDDTRGTIFFHIARAIKEIQPSYVLLENVKGLFSHDKGRTFGTIIQALDELGYVTEWGLFNSKYWGVPQNRERVYILVTRKDVWKEPNLFNLLKQQTSVDTRLIDILETDVGESCFLSESGYIAKEKYGRMGKQAVETIKENMEEIRDGYTINAFNKTIDKSGLSPTLTTRPEGFKTAILPITEDLRIRKLTPLECWRLQGFTDDQFYKAKESGVSNSQLYKQSGNAITISVADAIIKKITEGVECGTKIQK
ncbi:DNA (cytosine-5-)-methyltransferase [Staphylococcus aureus]